MKSQINTLDTRIYLVNNTSPVQTFLTSAGGTYVVQPGKDFYDSSPGFTPEGYYYISVQQSNDCITFQASEVTADSPESLCITTQIMSTNVNNFNYVTTNPTGSFWWCSQQPYNLNPNFPYCRMIWFIGDHGNVGYAGFVMTGPDVSQVVVYNDLPPDRQGIIIYYGNANPLPNPSTVTIP